jgi:hypothetical protein
MGVALFNPSGINGYSCIDKTLQNCSGPVAVAENESVTGQLTGYPNPASHYTTLAFQTKNTGIVNVKVFDAMGRIVDQFRTMANNGVNEIRLDVSGYTNGLYICEVVTPGKIFKSIITVSRN